MDTTTEAPRYVVYYRVSTKGQGESGLGLEAQRSYVGHFYDGANIVAEFVEVASAKSMHPKKRPKLHRALELCQAEGATLLVAKIDRLSRRTEDALDIYAKLDGRLAACDVPNLDKFTLTIFMAIADRERELISLRTKQALQEKRKNAPEWRKAPKAFRDGTAAKRSGQVNAEKARTNEHNRRAASMAKHLRENGWTFDAIAEHLNTSGFTSPRGSVWRRGTVQRLVKNAEKYVTQ